MKGLPRLERGHHRHVGGHLGQRDDSRHYVALVAAIVSTAVSAYATYSAGQAQSDAARYQGKVARNQAISAQQAADAAALQDRERTKRIMAANRAALGAS